MRLPKIPKELDPRRRFRKPKPSDSPQEPRAYGQHVDVTGEEDDIRQFERTTGEVVREGDDAAGSDATSSAKNQKAIHEMEDFEEFTDEPVRER